MVTKKHRPCPFCNNTENTIKYFIKISPAEISRINEIVNKHPTCNIYEESPDGDSETNLSFKELGNLCESALSLFDKYYEQREIIKNLERENTDLKFRLRGIK